MLSTCVADADSMVAMRETPPTALAITYLGHGGPRVLSSGPGVRPMEHTEHHDHDHSDVPSDVALRVKALESLLVEKGLVDPAALAFVNTFLVDNKVLKAPVDLTKAVDTRFWDKVPLADKKL